MHIIEHLAKIVKVKTIILMTMFFNAGVAVTSAANSDWRTTVFFLILLVIQYIAYNYINNVLVRTALEHIEECEVCQRFGSGNLDS